MRVILGSARAENHFVFTNDIQTKKIDRRLSTQSAQEVSKYLATHGIDRRIKKSFITPLLAKDLPTPDKFIKIPANQKPAYLGFTTEEKISLASDVFSTPTCTSPALENAAAIAAFIPETSRQNNPCTTPEAWSFSLNKRQLFSAKAQIPLTTIESLILKQLVLGDRRVCSKEELILGINRDPSHYSGLEMCLSRLQDKFINVYGERLFRSVRNRGYCLVQEVTATP